MENTSEKISISTPLELAEKACKAIMNTYTPEQLPPANSFHYHQGVFLYGMLRVWEVTGNQRYFDYIKGYIDSLIDEEGNLYFARDELDSVQAGILLFPLYEKTKDRRYLVAAKKLRHLLYSINQTTEGGFWHKDKYPYQMWLDGLFMAAPFMLMYNEHFVEEELVLNVVRQEKLMRTHMKDENTGLLFHAWDEKKVQPWANKDTGCSPEFWGRSIGWYGTALVDILELIDNKARGQEEIAQALKDLVPAIAQFQDEKTGLWYQIVDKGDREDNWLESSCSSLFIYFIAKAIKLGLADESYEQLIKKAYGGLIEHMVDVQNEVVSLKGICIGTSAGVYEYYVERPTSRNDLHGMGAFILASMALHEVTSNKK